MESFIQDLRYIIRALRRNSRIAALATVTLALGIGVNVAVFSLVDAVLLRPLPFRDPSRLVKITANNAGVGLRDIGLSVPELDDLKQKADIFDEISVIWPGTANLTGAQQPARLNVLGVSPEYFSMLGDVTPQVGRLFGSQDHALGFAEGVIISDGVWRQSFGSDPKIIGRKLRLDNDLYTVVGVLPPTFRHPARSNGTDVELWATAGFRADPFPPPTRNIRLLPGAFGRLKPGLNQEEAQARLDVLANALRNEYPNDYPSREKWTIEIEPLQQALVGNVRPVLLALMGTVLLIVLVAAVNIANLLLAQAARRQREVAMRFALGASRKRIVGQILTESGILCIVAGTIGTVIAAVTLPIILRFLPNDIPRLNEVRLDWPVLVAALIISIVAGLISGIFPALQSSRSYLSVAIREGSHGSGSSVKAKRLRGVLIVSELVVTMTLLIGAGLLLRTLANLLKENPGFNPQQVVAVDTHLPEPNDLKSDPYGKVEDQARFIHEVLRRITAVPGVELAGITTNLPFTSSVNRVLFSIADRPLESSEDLTAEAISVSPDYFKLLQTPLLYGRYFGEEDKTGSIEVAVIDQTTAARFWPREDAIGKRLRIRPDATVPWKSLPWMTVVGVIADIKQDGLDVSGVPHIYSSIYQHPSKALSVVMHTSLSPTTLEPQARHEIQVVDPNVPVFNLRTMNEVVEGSLATRRLSAELVSIFGALALLLSAVGVYGLLTYVVSQSSQEVGIRMALGALRSDIYTLFVARGMRLAAVGVVLGLILAPVSVRAIGSLLYGVKPFDFFVFIGVPLLLLLVALLATYVPARRASRLDPVVVLRNE